MISHRKSCWLSKRITELVSLILLWTFGQRATISLDLLNQRAPASTVWAFAAENMDKHLSWSGQGRCTWLCPGSHLEYVLRVIGLWSTRKDQKMHLRLSQGRQWWAPRVSARQHHDLQCWPLDYILPGRIWKVASPSHLASRRCFTSWVDSAARSSAISALGHKACQRSKTPRCFSQRPLLTTFWSSSLQPSWATHARVASKSFNDKSSSSEQLQHLEHTPNQSHSLELSRSGSERCGCTRLGPVHRLSWSAANIAHSMFEDFPWPSSSWSRSQSTESGTWKMFHASLCFSQLCHRGAGIWSLPAGWCCQHPPADNCEHCASASSLNPWWCETWTRWRCCCLSTVLRQFWATGWPWLWCDLPGRRLPPGKEAVGWCRSLSWPCWRALLNSPRKWHSNHLKSDEWINSPLTGCIRMLDNQSLDLESTGDTSCPRNLKLIECCCHSGLRNTDPMRFRSLGWFRQNYRAWSVKKWAFSDDWSGPWTKQSIRAERSFLCRCWRLWWMPFGRTLDNPLEDWLIVGRSLWQSAGLWPDKACRAQSPASSTDRLEHLRLSLRCSQL